MTCKINKKHKKLVESFGFYYKNEYSYGNHLKNAKKQFPELYKDNSISNEDLISYYLNYLNENKIKNDKIKNNEINNNKKLENDFLKIFGIENKSFYHFLIQAHIHGFNSDNKFNDVKNYFLWMVEKEEYEEQYKIKKELEEKENFIKKLKEKENIKIQEKINLHKSIFEKFGWNYSSEYSWGRIVSIAKRNLSEEILNQCKNDEEIIHKFHDFKLNKIKEKEYIDIDHEKFMKDNGKGGNDWHNTLVNARKYGFNSEDNKKDILDFWNYIENKENKKIEEINKIINEHKFICEKYNIIYTNEQTYSRYKNKAINEGYNSIEEYFQDINLIIKYNNKKRNNKIKISDRKYYKRLNYLNNNISFKNYIKFNLNNICNNTQDKKIFRKKYNKPGIIFLYGFDDKTNKKVCLTGGETNNIYSHILLFKRNSNKNIIKYNEKDNRWYKIANNYNNFIIYIFDNFYNIDKIRYRQEFELKYAIDNFAIYWKSTIGFQRKLTNIYSKFKKE